MCRVDKSEHLTQDTDMAERELDLEDAAFTLDRGATGCILGECETGETAAHVT